MLVKNHVTAEANHFVTEIMKVIAGGDGIVVNKKHLLRGWIKLPAIFLGYLNRGGATKDTKIGNVWFGTKISLIGLIHGIAEVGEWLRVWTAVIWLHPKGFEEADYGLAWCEPSLEMCSSFFPQCRSEMVYRC